MSDSNTEHKQPKKVSSQKFICGKCKETFDSKELLIEHCNENFQCKIKESCEDSQVFELIEFDNEAQPSVKLNETIDYTISNYRFDNLPDDICIEIWKDGRPFSYFIEAWLAENYPLIHIKGCKKYDFKDKNNPEILYDEKTFTKNGCNFCPSNMLGQGRSFDKKVFEEKTKKLVFCIVSNLDFPNIKIKFVKGEDLILQYPDGNISKTKFVEFFD